MTAPDIERRAAAGVTASGRTLTGYVATFGTTADIGGYTERIAPGAFAATLASGRDVLALSDHDPKSVLGRTKSGSLTLREDAKGLHFTLTLPNTQAGNDLVALAERNDLGGMSFGFVATDETWTGDIRELRAVDLHEVSVVQSWPAYGSTSVALRSRPRLYQCFFTGDANRAWLETCQ